MQNGRKIIWFENFPNGRFANSCFQFLYAEYLKKLGYEVILGGANRPRDTDLPWKMFNLPNNQIEVSKFGSGFLGDGKERFLGASNSIKIIEDYFKQHPDTVLSVNGYFQFDTGAIKSNKEYFMTFMENFGLSVKFKNPFQEIVKKYYDKIKGDYLITIHVRRGDYLLHENLNNWTSEVFYPLHLDNVINQLQKYITINRIKNTVIYVASDDINFCKSYFSQKKIDIITSEYFVDVSSSDHLMVDLAAMSACNMLIASNSSLSILGAMINDCGRVFWRQGLNKELVSFDPWSTPILYGPVLNNYALKYKC